MFADRRTDEQGELTTHPSGVRTEEAMPPENFPKIDVKISYFSAFLQAEIVSSAVVSKQD